MNDIVVCRDVCMYVCMCMYTLYSTYIHTVCVDVRICVRTYICVNVLIYVYTCVSSHSSQTIQNTNGTLCNHYPSEIIVLRSEKGRNLPQQ